MPPKVSSPFVSSSVDVGAKEKPTMRSGMDPWLKALSVTVGMQDEPRMRVPSDAFRSVALPSGHAVLCYSPQVKPTGPRLSRWWS